MDRMGVEGSMLLFVADVKELALVVKIILKLY